MSLIRKILGINNSWIRMEYGEISRGIRKQLRKKMRYRNGRPQGYGTYYFRGSYYIYKVKIIDFEETYYQKRRSNW